MPISVDFSGVLQDYILNAIAILMVLKFFKEYQACKKEHKESFRLNPIQNVIIYFYRV
jgi:hypothetical protein